MPSKHRRDKRRGKKCESDSDSSESIGSDDTYSEEEWETEDDSEYDAEEESSSSSEEEEEESDEEFEEDSDDDSDDSSYRPTKKSNKRNDDEDSEEEELDEEKIRKIVSKMFPSKYMKERVKDTSKKKRRKSKRLKNKKKKEQSESDEEYEEYMRGQEEENQINIIFGVSGIEEEEELPDDENEECDSEDEEMFMKESYQKLDLPEEMKKAEQAKKEKKKKKKAKNKSKDSQESDNNNDTFVSEYNDLVDMKKYLTAKLHEKPKSKTLLKSLNECKDNIKKLVKKTRYRNVKGYHKLINSHKQKMTNEMDYFKTKLSNKEQLKIMNDLKEINQQIQVHVPYRVSLLDSMIPTKYKASVMQKLNILKTMEPSDNEYYKIKNWVDAFMRIPFGKYKELNIKMENGVEECSKFMETSMNTLDTCVFGLNDAKMQILQMIGQWISNPAAMGTAIAIKGPPGTGKTSLIKEGISKILGREFAFIALGGS